MTVTADFAPSSMSPLISASSILAQRWTGASTELRLASLAVLREALTIYTGTRSERTPSEQNLYVAIQGVVGNREGDRLLGVTEESINDLKLEMAIFTANRPPLPVAPEEVITPAEWAAENPNPVLNAIKTVIGAVEIGLDVGIDAAVGMLREAILSEADEKLLGEATLIEVARKFIRAHKAHSMFGDDLTPAVEELRAAIYPRPDDNEEPYLYVLMRNDLGSLNAGKAVAQGTHASNQMVWDGMIATDPLAMALDGERATELAKLISEWSKKARGFGTCIVLSVNEREMRETVAAAKEAGLHADLTHDPSYPLWDKPTLHLIPLDTCAYVFARKGDAKPFVGTFPLMP